MLTALCVRRVIDIIANIILYDYIRSCRTIITGDGADLLTGAIRHPRRSGHRISSNSLTRYYGQCYIVSTTFAGEPDTRENHATRRRNAGAVPPVPVGRVGGVRVAAGLVPLAIHQQKLQ